MPSQPYSTSTAAEAVRLLPWAEVKKIVQLSKPRVYAKMRLGTFPLPLKLSANGRVAWLETEIMDWIATLPRAMGKAAE